MRSFIVAMLMLVIGSCQPAAPVFRVSSSIVAALGDRRDVSFCEEAPALIDATQPFYPLVALAQEDRSVSGDQLLRVIDEAEGLQRRFKRSFVPQRVVMPQGDRLLATVHRADAEEQSGCYVELSPVVANPYRSVESGVFVRFFRGGATGTSGSVVFWFGLDETGSVIRKFRLPIN